MSIPVWKIVKASVHDVWQHKREWGRMAGLLFLIWAVGFFFLPIDIVSLKKTSGADLLGSEGSLGAWAKLAHALCLLIIIPSLEISGFRYAVLGERKKNWWALNFDRRFFKFILYFFLICPALVLMGIAMVYLPLTLLKISPSLELGVIGIASVVGFYAALRLSLLKLLISIDIPSPLRASWHLLRGNAMRVFAITSLLHIGFGAGYFLIVTTLSQISGGEWEAPFIFIGGLFWVCVWATTTRANAYVFEYLSKQTS